MSISLFIYKIIDFKFVCLHDCVNDINIEVSWDLRGLYFDNNEI